MTQPPMSPPPPHARSAASHRGRAWSRRSSSIGVGLVIAIVSVVAIVIPLLGTFTSPVYAVPGDLQRASAPRALHRVPALGTRSAFGSVSDRSRPRSGSIRRRCRSPAPDGSTVPVSFDSDNETITRGSNVYTGVARVRRAGPRRVPPVVPELGSRPTRDRRALDSPTRSHGVLVVVRRRRVRRRRGHRSAS